MKAKMARSYRQLADFRAHAIVIYLMAFSIILVSTGGIVSSTIMGLLILLGIATLIFDGTASDVFLNRTGLRSMAILLGLALLWQGLGLLLRSPSDPRAGSVLGSAFGIAMLLPVLVAALQHDAKFRNQLFTVLFVLGSVAAALSILRHLISLGQAGNLSIRGLLQIRLVPVGRADHQILGAGGLAASFFAGLATYSKASIRQGRLRITGLALIALTVVLTQSRGPILGICLAVMAAYVVERSRGRETTARIAFALMAMCFLIPVGLVVMEPWIKDLVCTGQLHICRPSARQNVWNAVLTMVAERPWFGIGPTFRFPAGSVSHPHNGFLGLIFFFGLPMGLLFLGILVLAMRQALAASPSAGRTFAILGLFFSSSFVATDLSNPFGFVNTHYLYLWLPVFVASALGTLAAHEPRSTVLSTEVMPG